MTDERTPLVAPDGEVYARDEIPTVAGTQPAHKPPDMGTGRMVLLVGSLYICVILAALDTTIVTTLLAHIASDLKQLDNISWAATGYTVAYSAFQPLYGKFSDIVGRKRVMLFCILVFAIGCQMCGMAQSLGMLVAGRFVSGVGAGGMLSMSTITVSDYVPLRMRGIFQGLGNVSFGTGASLGGVFGGWMTAWGGWRLSFTAQIPLALVALFFVWLLVVDKPVDHSQIMQGEHTDHVVRRDSLERIDIVGSLSLVSTLLLLMLGVTTGGNQFPWLSVPIFGMFVGSGAMLALFVWWEVNKAVEPVIPIELLMHRTVISACLTNFFGSGFAYGFLYYGPIFLQSIYHYTYQTVAHRLVANFVGVAVGSLGAGFYMRYYGKYWALGVSSMLLTAVSAVLFAITPYLPFWVGASPYYQSLSYLLCGLGYASMLTVTLIALIAAAPPEFQATTTSAQYTFRGAGSSIGIAAAAAIFQNTLVSQLRSNVHGKHAKRVIKEVSKSVDAIWDMPKKLQPAILLSYERAGVAVFWFDIALAITGGVFSALQREHPLERH